MKLLIADSFTAAFGRLSNQDQKAVKGKRRPGHTLFPGSDL